MLLGTLGRFRAAPRDPRGLRGPCGPRGNRAIRLRPRSFPGDYMLPGGADDDEEPDRLGVYNDDVSPERMRQIVRALNVAYHTKPAPMTGEVLRDLLIDKWRAVYPVQICIGDEFQVYLQIEPRKVSDTDAKNKADVLLSGIGAMLTEWGVADAAWREIAKHPAKRVPSSGLLIALPIYFYPGRNAGSAASSRDSGDFAPGAIMPPSDSWNAFDQLESESSGDPPA